MPVSAASAADLVDLTRLFAGYLRFYQVPRADADIAAFLRARLERGDSQLFIARDGRGAAQGFVQLYPFLSSLALEPAWLLSDLYVDESARRCGVGEALMNAARAHAEHPAGLRLHLGRAVCIQPGYLAEPAQALERLTRRCARRTLGFRAEHPRRVPCAHRLSFTEQKTPIRRQASPALALRLSPPAYPQIHPRHLCTSP